MVDTPDTCPVIRGMRVDIVALGSISHRCVPGLCKDSKSCCESYEVCVGKKELPDIIGIMPDASTFSPDLRSGADYNNVFEEVAYGLSSIDTNEDGLCSFAYHGDENDVLCSLHSAAMELGLEPASVKPRSCVLWPLALSEGGDKVLSIQDDAFSFPCNTPRDGGLGGLDRSVSVIISDVFGKEFLAELIGIIDARGGEVVQPGQ